jgi:hypothetical protein
MAQDQQQHTQYHDAVDKALQIGALQLDHAATMHNTMIDAHQAQTARISAEQTPQSAGVTSSPTQSGQGN